MDVPMPPTVSNDPTLETLIVTVHEVIQHRTNGLIRDLDVAVHDGVLVLSGRTSRYYYKQLATSAALEASGDRPVENGIAVRH